MKTVISVIGKDAVGITAKVSAICAKRNANIVDITQSVLQDVFVMVMLTEIIDKDASLKSLIDDFKQLSSELSDTEDKIQAARRFYNAGAKELNTKVKTFPTNLINKLVGHFKLREYYEVAESEKAKIQNVPEVKF